jgi:pyruvate-formate lyase-activating enzyme
LFAYKRECFQEFENEISLVLWCMSCDMNCNWCSVKDILSDQDSELEEDYLELIKNKTELETAVVFLGGEPTLREEGLVQGCQEAKLLGMKTKVFTNGNSIRSAELLRELGYAKLIDSVALDYKYPIQNIQSFIASVIKTGINLELRTTMHPGLTESDLSQMKQVGETLKVKHIFQRYFDPKEYM